MRKLIVTALCLVGVLGVFAEENTPKMITVILENNLKQGGKWQERLQGQNFEYVGDPKLQDAFRTVHPRLTTMLGSSGRVNVKEEREIDKIVTDEDIYLCSYKLVQGKRTGFKRGNREEYIIGINLQAWNYVTGAALPKLMRTVEYKLFEDTEENAFKYVTSHLAFITLGALSPVTVLNKNAKGTIVSVSAGGEILQPGDKLAVVDEFRETKAELCVERSDEDGDKSFCAIVTGDLLIGDRCVFIFSDDPQITRSQNKKLDPTVRSKVFIHKMTIPTTFKSTTMRVKLHMESEINPVEQRRYDAAKIEYDKKLAEWEKLRIFIENLRIIKGAILPPLPPKPTPPTPPRPQQVAGYHVSYFTDDIPFARQYPDAPTILLESIKAQDLGLQVISLDGVPPTQVASEDLLRDCDYELICNIIAYTEKHTGGKQTIFDRGTSSVPFNQEGVLLASLTLKDIKTKMIVGGKTIPMRVVCKCSADLRLNDGNDSTDFLLAWSVLAEEAAKEIAAKVREVVATIKK